MSRNPRHIRKDSAMFGNPDIYISKNRLKTYLIDFSFKTQTILIKFSLQRAHLEDVVVNNTYRGKQLGKL